MSNSAVAPHKQREALFKMAAIIKAQGQTITDLRDENLALLLDSVS